MMKSRVSRTWAVATQINLEVILKKIQLPEDSQTRVSYWGLVRGKSYTVSKLGPTWPWPWFLDRDLPY